MFPYPATPVARRVMGRSTTPKRGQVLVELPTSVAAKVLLLNTMLEQGVTASELARRLHTSPQAVNRIVKLKHATKIDTIADAIGVLGRRLTVALA